MTHEEKNSAGEASAPEDVRDPKSGLAPLNHSYDGIQEFDNRLPNWWLFTLYASMIFAPCYWLYYHTTGAPTAHQVYEAEWAKMEQEAAKHQTDPKALVAMSKDPAVIKRGKEVVTSTCAACHKADGGGLVGPNLTDSVWLHGGKPADILKIVSEGFVAKGMPAWGPMLGQKKVTDVVAFVLSIKNTNVPGGKAPQGKPEEG